MNNNTQESKIQLEYINKCTELVKEKYEKRQLSLSRMQAAR